MSDDLLFLIAQYANPSAIQVIRSTIQGYDLAGLFRERLGDQYFWLFHEDRVYLNLSPHRRLYEFMQQHPNFDEDRMAVEKMRNASQLLKHFKKKVAIRDFKRNLEEWRRLMCDLMKHKNILLPDNDFADWVHKAHKFYWSDSVQGEFLCALETMTMDDVMDMLPRCKEDIFDHYLMQPNKSNYLGLDLGRVIGRDYDTISDWIEHIEKHNPRIFHDTLPSQSTVLNSRESFVPYNSKI